MAIGTTPRKVEVRAVGSNVSIVGCRFYPDGTNDPDWLGDAVQAVEHTATGKWTVRLHESVHKVIGISLGLGTSTPANDRYLNMSIDNEGSTSSLEIVVCHVDNTTLADIASGTDEWIGVTAIIERDTGRSLHVSPDVES